VGIGGRGGEAGGELKERGGGRKVAKRGKKGGALTTVFRRKKHMGREPEKTRVVTKEQNGGKKKGESRPAGV